jgi:hypothetical protein
MANVKRAHGLWFELCFLLVTSELSACQRIRPATRPAHGANDRVGVSTASAGPLSAGLVGPQRAMGSSGREPTASVADPSWRAFRDAVANGNRQEVAKRTHFPLRDPRWPHSLSREEFLEAFERLFSAGVRKQIAHGVIKRVTARDVVQAQRDGLDACGARGDFLLELPSGDVDHDQDDEAFLRLIFKRKSDALLLWEIIGCS